MSAHGNIFDSDLLPCPRLELRWHRQDNPEWQWIVDYNLVILLEPYDVRHTKKAEYLGKTAEKQIRLGRTKVGTERDPLRCNDLETPFRDGVHIRRDAFQLRVPLYVVWDDKAQALSPLPRDPVHSSSNLSRGE